MDRITNAMSRVQDRPHLTTEIGASSGHLSSRITDKSQELHILMIPLRRPPTMTLTKTPSGAVVYAKHWTSLKTSPEVTRAPLTVHILRTLTNIPFTPEQVNITTTGKQITVNRYWYTTNILFTVAVTTSPIVGLVAMAITLPSCPPSVATYDSLQRT